MKCDKCNETLEYIKLIEKYYCLNCKKQTKAMHADNVNWSTHYRCILSWQSPLPKKKNVRSHKKQTEKPRKTKCGYSECKESHNV